MESESITYNAELSGTPAYLVSTKLGENSPWHTYSYHCRSKTKRLHHRVGTMLGELVGSKNQ